MANAHFQIFKRTNITLCNRYDDRLISYCDTGDVYCDSGNDREVHGSYVEVYGKDVVEYVVDKYNKAEAAATSSAAASTTVSPTASETSSVATPSETTDAGAMLVPGRSLMVTVPLVVMGLVFYGV